MEVLDTSVANVALPNIAGNLSAGTDEATWVLTSYLISNAIVLPATGWLGNHFGRKRFLITCIVIFTISSFLCGAAHSLGMLIFARVLQGAGGGALQPISQAVLLESFPPQKRGVAMAAFGMGVVTAPIIGPTLGGWITDNLSWRWVFYINLPIGLLAIFLVQAFVEDPPYIRRARSGKIDFIGFGFMALWLATLQIILDKGERAEWFDAVWVRWFALVSVASLIAFIWWELREKEPIVNLRVFLNRNFAVGTLLMTVLGAVLYGTIALLPIFLQTLLGYPAMTSGMALSPRGFGSIVSMIIVGRLIGVADGRFLITFGLITLALSSYMYSIINLDIGMFSVILPNIVSGFAMGFMFVPLTTMSMGTLANEQMGNATGIFNLMRNVGGGIGISVVTTLLSRFSQVHQTIMTAHMTPYDPAYTQRLAAARHAFTPLVGAGRATQMSYGVVYTSLVRQSTLMAFVDNFRVMALLCLMCLGTVFLFKKVKRHGPVAPH